jgi:hypothetical protein
MEALRNQLKGLGVQCDAMNDATVKAVAKALKLSIPDTHTVSIVEYTAKGSGRTGKYVKTDGYVLGERNGKKETAQGLFVRVEIIDAAIADLIAAKGLLGQ